MVELIWLVPALPLLGFFLLLLIGHKVGEPGSGWIATIAAGGSFLATLAVFVGLLGRDGHAGDRSYEFILFEWLPAGSLKVEAGFLVDPLSITMALFVTGVGSLIHLYSIGYMHGDPKFEVPAMHRQMRTTHPIKQVMRTNNEPEGHYLSGHL